MSRSHVENRRLKQVWNIVFFLGKTPFFPTMIPCALTLKRGRSLRKESRMIMLFTCMSFLFISSYFWRLESLQILKKRWKSKVKTDTGSHLARTTLSRYQCDDPPPEILDPGSIRGEVRASPFIHLAFKGYMLWCHTQLTIVFVLKRYIFSVWIIHVWGKHFFLP